MNDPASVLPARGRYPRPPVKRSRPSRPALVLWAVLALWGAVPGGARADEDAPSLTHALFLEKTAHDPEKALAVFEALRQSASADAATRAEAALGAARCLLALRREEEAVAAWRTLLDDADAPIEAKQEARARIDERERERKTRAQQEAEAREAALMRSNEDARRDSEERKRAAARLVENARAFVREKRYDDARDALIQALERNPRDPDAAALLEEVAGHQDRVDLLRQAIRFVTSTRLSDYRRLSAVVDELREAGLRSRREGRPAEAARTLRDALTRIDESDFYADLSEPRRQIAAWLERAISEAQAKGERLDGGTAVPAERKDAGASHSWRSDFFALLGRVFASRTEGGAPLRFYDVAIPPNPDPERGPPSLEGTGIAAKIEPGTLRRARWLERHVRTEVSAGQWGGADRVLDRYEDVLIAQHTPQVLRQVEGLVASFPAGPPPPVLVDVRVLAAKPGGAADVIRVLGLASAPTETGQDVVAKGRRLDEWLQDLKSESDRWQEVARARVRLAGRHTTTVRFREQTSDSPLYADTGFPPIVVADRDAAYGLDLELYAEDLLGRSPSCAVSVAAVVSRPDRARMRARAGGAERSPTFLHQTIEADRRVPHSGTLVLLGLSNPFKATGAGGDPRGGEWPDLVVLLSARPVDAAGTGGPDVPPAESMSPPPALPATAQSVVRDYDLGPLGTEVQDEPPPEDWPSSPAALGARPERSRASREAWLAGWLSGRVRLETGKGSIVVREGRALATLSEDEHMRLAYEVSALARDASLVFSIEALATEVPAERTPALLGAAGVGREKPERIFRLDAAPAAALEDRLKPFVDAAGLHALDARTAARHTQLVTLRSVRSRGIVSDFRTVRAADGSTRTLPVSGTLEEGILLAVRPVAEVGGLLTIEASAALARVLRSEEWRPPGAAGDSPPVTLPDQRVVHTPAYGTLTEGQTLLFVVPAPGSDGARAVFIRVRRWKP
jgi:tetratricopeptide (TPR) repeat protein